MTKDVKVAGKRNMSRRYGRFLHTIVFAAAIAAAASGVVGQEKTQEEKEHKTFLYRWTDDKGIVHITDQFVKIPEKYRSKARKTDIQVEKGTSELRYDEGVPGLTGEMETSDEVEEEIRKAEWQDRIHDWKQKLADAEKRYRLLETERNEVFGRWGTPAYAPPEVKLRAEQIEKDMQAARSQIDEANNMLNVVIPEDARKAGIPPGWLRE